MGVNITNLQLYSLGGYYLDWVLIFAGLKKKKKSDHKKEFFNHKNISCHGSVFNASAFTMAADGSENWRIMV